MAIKKLDDNPYQQEIIAAMNAVIEFVNIGKGEFPEGDPDDSWTVVQIKAYLDQENIDYTGITVKSELLELVPSE